MSPSRHLRHAFPMLLTLALLLALIPNAHGASFAQDEDSARIHYHRNDGDYEGWGLHVWQDTTEAVTWTEPLEPAGEDEFGLFWDVGLADDAESIGLIVHKGEEKDPGPDMFLDLNESREAWVISGDLNLYTSEPDLNAVVPGDILAQRAHWVSRQSILWNPTALPEDAVVTLHAASNGGMQLGIEGIAASFAQTYELTLDPDGADATILAQFPHLVGLNAFTLPQAALNRVPVLLRGQLAVSVVDGEGNLIDATGLQIPGVIDDVYAYEGELGIIWDEDVPTLHLWAPTAKNVRLLLFESADAEEPAEVVNMRRGRGDALGVFSVTGEEDWAGMYYLYEVRVFVPSTGVVETNLVTDPYSLSLTTNSARSQIVDLTDPALLPEGWADLEKPPFDSFEDAVLYELHVRDFSAADGTVPEALRGTYAAFALDESNGVEHLRLLADAGVTHLHLLPTFNIATIDEDRSTWVDLERDELAELPPDSPEQQAAIFDIRDEDGFNWGYDPFHYGVPEGSYSTNPGDTSRILEYRQMVQALNQMGLRVVSDVVFNHTNASGQSERSVLDRIVPGYYHRLNPSGVVENSTCCANTATEHAMMEKLMIDTLLLWAKEYKVDGFRFDLMGHHMLVEMENVRTALDDLTLEEDGIDGSKILLYGEGWNFGEVADSARGVNATQLNVPGTGIATFNDRIRDAVRGVGPFDTGENLRKQGFVSGLFLEPNELGEGDEAERNRLLLLADQIRVGMTGNLADYLFLDRRGLAVTGVEVDYNGSPTGYALDPQETVNYASAHDNQTLFDVLTFGAPIDTPMSERVKMQSLALSVVALGQGIPFFHAGSEILRSKSFDRDSYNSGDWFNAIDWTYEENNFGHGLPVAEKNEDDWPIMAPLLADPNLKPEAADILAARSDFLDLLQIRSDSPLFRLESAAQVDSMLHFHNTGPDQIPGLILASLADIGEDDGDVDPDREALFVLINAAPEAVEFALEALVGMDLVLHPVLATSSDSTRISEFDEASGRFTVPGRMFAVFSAAELSDDFLAALAEQEAMLADLRANPPELPDEEPDTLPDPESVSFPGDYVALIGGNDWAPDDPLVQAVLRDEDGLWVLAVTLPAGSYNFKVAINGSWDENYGVRGEAGGADIGLTLEEESEVLFTYDRATQTIAALVDGEDISEQGSVVHLPDVGASFPISAVSFPGDYVEQIGGANWAPEEPLIQADDADGDGTWVLTVDLPAGSYEFKAAINQSWEQNYGLNGELDGANVPFSVPDPGGSVTFLYERESNEVSVEVALAPEDPPARGDGRIGVSGLLHDSRSDAFRNPVGAVPGGTPVAIRFRTHADDVEGVRLLALNEATGIASVLPLQRVAVEPGRGPFGTEWWEVLFDSGEAPTIHSYVFEIEDGGQVLTYLDDHLNGGTGHVAPLTPGVRSGWDLYTYVPGFETPEWVRDAVIYQIFPDRFRNGDERNDPTEEDWFYPQERGHAFPIEPWNTLVPDTEPSDPNLNPDWFMTYNSTFYGGDIQGVWDQLDYLESLGVTTLYFNPIFESPSNHKYDGRTYRQVDDNLAVLGDPEASNELFAEFAADVAARGMHIVLDGVPNHFSSDSPYFDRFERYENDGACESVDSPWREWFFLDPAPAGAAPDCAGDAVYRGWAGVSTLPQADTSSPEVIANWLDPDEGVANLWLDLPGVDGWRIDVVPDVVAVNPDFFSIFRNVVKAEHPEAILFSETWGEDDVRHRLLGDEFDTTMNYRFRNAVLGFLRDSDFTEDGDGGILALDAAGIEAGLRAIEEDYPRAAFETAMNLLDSHDVNRAVRVLDHDGIDYETLMPVGDFVDGRRRLALAALLQFTLPGAPTIYYGDEVGLVGFGSQPDRDDPYNRQPYPWPDEAGYDDLPTWRQQDPDLLAHYQLLGELRATHSFLRTGSWDTIVAEGELYIYGRRDESGAAIVAINGGTTPASAVLDLAGYLPIGLEMESLPGGEVSPLPNEVVVDPLSYRLWITTDPVDLIRSAPAEVVTAIEGEGFVEIEVLAEDDDAAEVLLWRSRVDGGFEIVATSPVPDDGSALLFRDENLRNGASYFYRLSTRRADGLMGPTGPTLRLIPQFDIDGARLQAPVDVVHIISAVNPTPKLFGTVIIDGVTEGMGAADGIMAQLGMIFVQPDGEANPESVIWTAGTYDGEENGADRYSVSLLPNATGEYLYGWRFSANAGRDWVYADREGMSDVAVWDTPGRLTVIPSDDTDPPNRPFRIEATFIGGSEIVIEWRASRTPDLNHYFLCRRDVTAGEESCAVSFILDEEVRSYRDVGVVTGHLYEYTVQTVDDSFNYSPPSDILAVTAVESFVEVTFQVLVPDYTPEGDVVYIAGDDRDVFGGSFDPARQPMEKIGENLWSWTVLVKEGTPLLYKYTRGDWERVEQWGTIAGMENRQLVVTADEDGTMLVADVATDWDEEGPDDRRGTRNWRDPLVVDVTAAAGEVRVRFNRSVTPASELAGVVRIEESGGTEIAGSAIQESDETILFVPDAALPAGEYTITVDGVLSDVSMQQPYVGVFEIQ